MKTAYYTIDGEIIGESTNGVCLDYLTDALGSVTAKVDQTAQVVSTARYKPYGDKLAGTDYVYGWVGGHGYRKAASGSYMRARHYSSSSSWTSIDKYWPGENAYGYVVSNPANRIDPSGAIPAFRSAATIPTFNCGIYKFYWNFLFFDWNARGYLIQEVTTTLTGSHCPPAELKNNCPHFYEVWPVFGGRAKVWHGKHDGWINPDFGDDYWSSDLGGNCSYGKTRIDGKLYFISDPNAPSFETIKSMGFYFDDDPGNRHVSCSGDIPSTLKPLVTLGESFAPGFVTDDWKCCGKKNTCSSDDKCNCPVEGPCGPETSDYDPKW